MKTIRFLTRNLILIQKGVIKMKVYNQLAFLVKKGNSEESQNFLNDYLPQGSGFDCEMKLPEHIMKQFEDKEIVNLSDHKFAEYLRKKDPDWSFEHLFEFTFFYNQKNKVIAIAKYDNEKLTKIVWIEKEK